MRIIEKCNRPKLFLITGRNGLYFLLRLGRLSYAIGFQSETLNLYQIKTYGNNLCCNAVKIDNFFRGDLPYFALKCDNLL